MVSSLLPFVKPNGKHWLVSFAHRSVVVWVKHLYWLIHPDFKGFFFLPPISTIFYCAFISIFICKVIKNCVYATLRLVIRYTLSAWASGTGAAGVLGALTYTALISIGFTARTSMLLMLLIPTLQAFAFYVLLQESHRPNTTSTSTTSLLAAQSDSEENASTRQTTPDFNQRIQYLPHLYKYVLPLFTVYISEYLINQGLVRNQSNLIGKSINNDTNINFHRFLSFSSKTTSMN